MTLPTDSSRFRLHITHVDGEGHLLKISGQREQTSLVIESLFDAAREDLEKGIGAVPAGAIHEGVICAAKYKDGAYYRAKVINTSNLSNGLVAVHFIDYGNKDIISLSTIRFLDNYNSLFLQLPGQASDYYLSRIIHPSGRWEEPLLLKLQSLLCYAEYPATIEANKRTLPIIAIEFKGNDLSSHLVANRFGIEIRIDKQEDLILQLTAPKNKQGPMWQPSFAMEPPSYTEHVPFLVNQNFPSNPASAMRLQQNVALPFNGSIPPPSLISQRLLVNKAPRTAVNLKAPIRQPQHATSSAAVTVSTPPSTPIANKPSSPKKSTTYKSRLLEINSQHKVFVSFAEEGPELFAVQLVSDAKRLQEMMDDINRRPHSSLAEPPMIGTVCLGRMSGDRIICRAIVMNLSGSQCKLFFVDFGDTEMVSYYDIFDIPEEFVKPNVFAMRFCLSGVKKLEKGPHLNETFKQLVNGKVLTLRVVSPEGPPLIQYGELFLDNKNVLDLLMANMKDKLQFKWIDVQNHLGTKKSVLISYVDSCLKFFMQLTEKIDDLNAVMDAVKVHCENSSSPGLLPVGAACCARFPDDNNWYRAQIKEHKGKNRVTVQYVDYGNEQEVDMSDLRTITPELVSLPAQAMKCSLKGFHDKPVETTTSNLLEMLVLEKTLTATIIGLLSGDLMLVSLYNDTENPPFDVGRKITLLSAPRSTIETKATTPVRKDAPESFSSPEGSEDSRKKGFRREKSFKDDRRPPREGNEEFGQRAGSFRARDNKDGFDRAGPGRHSDKFGGRSDGRPDRADRRGGPKPWEKDSAPAAPAAPAGDDEWEEAPAAPPAFTPPRHNRDNRDRDNRDNRDRDNWDNRDRDNRDNRDRDNRDNRRKPRDQQHEGGRPRPGWKPRDDKRPRQEDFAPKGSVQDRLKRNQQSNDWEEKKSDDWGNKTGGRPDRRDNRGDRRDNWGEKKEGFQKREFRDNDNWGEKKEGFQKREFKDNDNWGEKKEGFQKREFRDNNRERGDRTRNNFTPRDRAERSFGSDKSDKSFRSQDSGGRSGRAPPYKPRSKFTQVQYKELSDPVPLTTPFEEPTVENGAQHEVSVTWIISPESFYTQIVSLQPNFLDMMHKIPELYKGVKSFTGEVPVGASVLARYPADGVLYRATVVSVQPFSKFIVRYVDFGNKQLVDAKDIWQLDKSLLELPKMAVHCSLLGVAPKDGEWKANPDIDLCFNAPRYQCVFHELVEEGQWKVYLWNNGVNVADTLIEKQLAVMSEHQSNVALKDEAIDLSIIVGQQILCKVTHVESFEKFYVQLDLDKAALVEAAIDGFDTNKLTPLVADNLSEGVHCTVKYEGKIYRAILEDASDADKIRAVLPDYGFSITTSLANLMILPTELSVYYYQSLECCLNNYTAESKTLMTVEEMKQKLKGNKFIIYINDVDGIRLVSTLYEIVSGQKVAIFEPDEGAYDQVIQLCTRAVFNYNFGLAYISHADNLNEFYLQKASDSDRIAQLLDELYKFYEEGTPEALTTFEADGLCAAQSADGNWYRATIASAQDAHVKVHFSDYGNSETVAKDAIKKLDPKFYEPCALALVASLGLVALQDDALNKLIEWTTEKEVQVTLALGPDGWLASLHLDGVDLSMKLVNEKLATPQVSNEETKPEPIPEEPVSLPTGCTQVYISHIDTPGHFWLQMSDKIDKIEEIQAELQENAGTYTDIENREMGTMCIAKYLADDQWYRAEILDSDSDITTVRFTDYGNTDVLDNKPGLIKTMPEHMKEIERYALKSSVNAVPTGTGEWSEPASEYFTQLVGDLSAPVDALIVLKDVTTYVDLFVNGHNLTDKLVSEGYATKSEEAECGDLPSCFASHINSPSEFWIQLETATAELQAMEAAMVDAENFPALTEKEEGVICAAKYPEDGQWYRAQVIVDGSEGTEVLFMDYGNASIANELRSLPDELKAKPALSRKCALQKPRDIKSWSRKSEIKFNELAAEGATIFNVQFIASGDISIVELYLEGKSVTEELVGLCEEHPSSERPTPVGQDLECSGKICFVNSLEDFYVQLDDFAPEIDKVIEKLANAADFEAANELKVGLLCAAHWDEDEQWYRAKILELCDESYHVLFIDYGNKAKCQEFRQLPKELLEIEPAAKCCRLAGIGDDNALIESAKEKLDDLAAEAATFQIVFLDSTKEPALVKLLLDGKDFATYTVPAEAANEEIKPTEDKVSAEDAKTVKETSEEVSDEPVEELQQEPAKDTSEEITPQPTAESTVNDEIIEAIGNNEIIKETNDNNLTASKEKDISEESIPESKESQHETENENSAESKEEVADKPVEALQQEPVKDTSEEITPQPTAESTVNDEIIEAIGNNEIIKETNDNNLTESKEKDISKESIPESKKSQHETENENSAESKPKTELEQDDKEIGDEECELDSSNQDLNESIESSNTVIENKSFEGKADSLSDDVEESKDETTGFSETLENSNETIKMSDDVEESKDETGSPDKNLSSETLENSNDTIKTPERDDSRDSLNTDTGYTSDHEKLSPINDETQSPVKDSVSPTKEKLDLPKKEDSEKTDDKPVKADVETKCEEKGDDKKVEEKTVHNTEHIKSTE